MRLRVVCIILGYSIMDPLYLNSHLFFRSKDLFHFHGDFFAEERFIPIHL